MRIAVADRFKDNSMRDYGHYNSLSKRGIGRQYSKLTINSCISQIPAVDDLIDFIKPDLLKLRPFEQKKS